MNRETAAELAALAAAAAPREPNADARAALIKLVAGHAEDFLGGLDAAPTYRKWDPGVAAGLEPEFAEAGRDPRTVLDFVGAAVDQPGIATASPRFTGYVPGGGLFHAALGDFLAATSNK